MVAGYNTEMVYPPTDVTHPSTNRTWHRATTLIATNTLSLRHAMLSIVIRLSVIMLM